MSFSADPNRRRPYDRDLRWRIVFQRIGMGLQYDKIAQNLNVSTSTAYRICSRFDVTGEVQPTLNKHRPYLQRLDQQSQLYVVGLIMENPALYLAEICQHIHKVFALNACYTVYCVQVVAKLWDNLQENQMHCITKVRNTSGSI